MTTSDRFESPRAPGSAEPSVPFLASDAVADQQRLRSESGRSVWLGAQSRRVSDVEVLEIDDDGTLGAVVWAPGDRPVVLDALGRALWPYLDGSLSVATLVDDVRAAGIVGEWDPELLVVIVLRAMAACGLLDVGIDTSEPSLQACREVAAERGMTIGGNGSIFSEDTRRSASVPSSPQNRPVRSQTLWPFRTEHDQVTATFTQRRGDQPVCVSTDVAEVAAWLRDRGSRIGESGAVVSGLPAANEVEPGVQRIRAVCVGAEADGVLIDATGSALRWADRGETALGLVATEIAVRIGPLPIGARTSLGPCWVIDNGDAAVVVPAVNSWIDAVASAALTFVGPDGVEREVRWRWEQHVHIADDAATIFVPDVEAARSWLDRVHVTEPPSDPPLRMWTAYRLVGVGCDQSFVDVFEAIAVTTAAFAGDGYCNDEDTRASLLRSVHAIVLADLLVTPLRSPDGLSVVDQVQMLLGGTFLGAEQHMVASGQLVKSSNADAPGDGPSLLTVAESTTVASSTMLADVELSAAGARLLGGIETIGSLTQVMASVKIMPGILVTDREVFVVNLDDPDRTERDGRLERALSKLGLGDDVIGEVIAARTVRILIGHESGADGSMRGYKVYVPEPSASWWSDFGERHPHSTPSRGSHGEPRDGVPAYVAWKKQADFATARLAIYWPFTEETITATQAIDDVFGAVWPLWSHACRAMWDPSRGSLDRCLGTSDLSLDEQGGRRSVDLEVPGKASSNVDRAAIARWLAAIAGLARPRSDELATLVARQQLQRVIVGVDAQGLPFVTLYHEPKRRSSSPDHER